jgi:hypothetical protein
MSNLATLDLNADDLSALYSTMDSGPSLARARINKDSSIEVGEELVDVPSPSIALSHPDYGEVYSKNSYFRIFLDTMQTSVFDADQEKFSNISQHFKNFSETALDWFGGDKCGWIPAREKEKLRGIDPVAYANATKVKLYRHIFGLIKMDDPVVAGSEEKIKIEDVPFRMKLGPSNFMEVSKVMGGMIKQQYMPLNFDMKISFKQEKRGSNKWFVLKYQPMLNKMHPLTDELREYLSGFVDLVRRENEQVATKMRENSSGLDINDDDFSDIIDGD